MSTRSRRYGPRDPHAPNTEHSYPPYHRKMLFFMLQRSVLTPNNPPRRSGLSEGFPRTYSGPHAVTTPPNIRLSLFWVFLYIIIASPRPIWAQISRARSILYIKGFPTDYWTNRTASM